jgi:hypothetical protein
MIKTRLFLLVFFLTILTGGFAQSIRYSVPSKPWSEDLGSHRAEIKVALNSDVVYVNIPWRRRDRDAGQKCLVITDGKGKRMRNLFRLNVNREAGEILFQPESGVGIYYVYYMPYTGNKKNGSFEGDYLKQEPSPDSSWVKQNHLSVRFFDRDKNTAKAKVLQLQSRTAFDSFFPMEVCATGAEVNSIINHSSADYILFPEDRKYPIRMTSDLPQKWILYKPMKVFKSKAKRNEYFVFQIGVFAAKKELKNIKVKYGKHAERLTCFNVGGIDCNGKPFTQKVDVAKGKVQALWFGVDIPYDAVPGNFSTSITIMPENEAPQTITVELQIQDQVLADRGDAQPWRHSRLRWLNSTLGFNEEITAPFTALSVQNRTIKSMMHRVSLDESGFIDSIVTQDNQFLTRPIQFIMKTGQEVKKVSSSSFQFTEKQRAMVSWTAKLVSDDILINMEGYMEYDGHIRYNIHLKALNKVDLEDVQLEIPLKKNIAQYFMGMGLNGQACPESYNWKWSGPQNSFWIGSADAGIHCKMLGAAYSGPLLNLYHPAPPPVWYNNNKGGFKLKSSANEVVATTYTGPRTLRENEELNFQFSLLVTPIKQVNTADQFTNRYYHKASQPAPSGEDLKSGIKITNVHHANSVNPYINYPFIAVDSMKRFVNKWHRKGLKVKIYYTIRELTNQVPEIWALRSLGNEIFAKGQGGGYPWLREHLVDDYNVQWFTPISGYEACDAAILTNGQSRWYNYYIEGLNWLVKNVDIDGLYLDDVAFDRNMLKRIRKVMDEVKPGCLLDLHSNTGFSVGPANQYTEYFPFINKIWFGESFQYNKMSPENWLVESSGIPFGIMGDMLHAGGNPWRGLVYGMTVRYPWFTEGVNCDPRAIWKVWNSFGIAGSKMIGYWNTSCPVKTSNSNVLATVYKKHDKSLVSVASWDKGGTAVQLLIDWKSLGLDPAKAKLIAPEIPGFQPAKKFNSTDSIFVEPAKGWLLIISE